MRFNLSHILNNFRTELKAMPSLVRPFRLGLLAPGRSRLCGGSKKCPVHSASMIWPTFPQAESPITTRSFIFSSVICILRDEFDVIVKVGRSIL
jgi:hypothetical protein